MAIWRIRQLSTKDMTRANPPMAHMVLRCRHFDQFFDGDQPIHTLYTLEAVNLTSGQIILLQTRSGADGPFVLALADPSQQWYVDTSTFRFGLPYSIPSDELRHHHVLMEMGHMLGGALAGELPEHLRPSYQQILQSL